MHVRHHGTCAGSCGTWAWYMHMGCHKTGMRNHCETFGVTCIIAVTTVVVSVVKAIKPTQNTIQSQNNTKEQCRVKFSCAIHVQNVCSHYMHSFLLSTLPSVNVIKLASVCMKTFFLVVIHAHKMLQNMGCCGTWKVLANRSACHDADCCTWHEMS